MILMMMMNERYKLNNHTTISKKKPSPKTPKTFQENSTNACVAVRSLRDPLNIQEKNQVSNVKILRNQIQKCDARNFSTAVDSERTDDALTKYVEYVVNSAFPKMRMDLCCTNKD